VMLLQCWLSVFQMCSRFNAGHTHKYTQKHINTHTHTHTHTHKHTHTHTYTHTHTHTHTYLQRNAVLLTHPAHVLSDLQVVSSAVQCLCALCRLHPAQAAPQIVGLSARYYRILENDLYGGQAETSSYRGMYPKWVL